MKEYKTVDAFIKNLNELAKHPVRDLRGVEKYSKEQIDALVAIKAFINNELGEYFSEFHI